MSAEFGQRYPEPTVGALILNGKGEILLKSRKWGDRYTIAGGLVEVGETLVAALQREIREEVGLGVRDVRFLMTQEAILSGEFWKPKHFIFFDFVCKATGGEPHADGREIQSCEWVDAKDALRLDLDSFTRRMIEEFLSTDGPRKP